MQRKANGFKRFVACLIDVLPIWLVSLVIYQTVTGESPLADDLGLLATPGRILVRDGWLIWWPIYCTIAECTPWRGTFGKKVLGIEVLGPHRRPPGFKRALGRNASKIISAVPCYLGFFWAFFSKSSNAWHDSIARCGVYERR